MRACSCCQGSLESDPLDVNVYEYLLHTWCTIWLMGCWLKCPPNFRNKFIECLELVNCKSTANRYWLPKQYRIKGESRHLLLTFTNLVGGPNKTLSWEGLFGNALSGLPRHSSKSKNENFVYTFGVLNREVTQVYRYIVIVYKLRRFVTSSSTAIITYDIRIYNLYISVDIGANFHSFFFPYLLFIIQPK